MSEYLSIITNFGCHYTCPYCIVKNNNLKIPRSTVEGLSRLSEEIRNTSCSWVSLSGGGDPLHNYEQNKVWYDKLFSIVPESIKLEMHTSYLNVPIPYNKFDRVVYHLHSLEQLKYVKRHSDEVVRVVFVVTPEFTEDLIDRIAEYCQNSNMIDELSFRQMIDNHYNETYYCQEYLKEGHKKLWYYIEQNDYNIYYCENKVYTEYRKIGNQ